MTMFDVIPAAERALRACFRSRSARRVVVCLATWSLGCLLSLFEAPCLAADKAAEPTTAQAAARLLDLRTLPLPEGARPGGIHTMAILMYEQKAAPKAAFAQLLKQFAQKGWKELPGTYLDNQTGAAHVTKDGFILALSASDLSSDPQKAGMVSVTIVNHGNVDSSKLPVPPGVKPFYSRPSETSYLTDAGVAETAEACRKLLEAAGWEPYGTASADPNSPMMYFKKNAIRVMAWISPTPAQNNKTSIRYSTDLLSADLPVPPDAPDPRYNDSDKSLRYDYPGEDIAPLVEFYTKKLTAQGWKPTTDKPITDDRKGTAFLVFRNEAKEIISLDMAHFTGIVRVDVTHQTAAELEASERLAKQAAEREKAAMAERDKKIKLVVPLPPGAKEIEQTLPSLFEFKVAKDQGPAALEFIRKHFLKADWTEESEPKLDKHHGEVHLKKGEETLDVSYITSGFTPVEIRVSGSHKHELEAKITPGEAPAPTATAGTPKQPAKKRLPGLPEGIELPDMPELDEALKSVEEATGKALGKKAPAAKAPATGKAGGTVKVADLPIPPDAGVEYSKITKMIDVKSASDVESVAQSFTEALEARGWQKDGNGIIDAKGGILKFVQGGANLTMFLHDRDGGSEVKLVTKGLDWSSVPAGKAAPKMKSNRPARTAAKPSRPASPASEPDEPSEPETPDEPARPTAPRIAARPVSVAEQKQTGVNLWVDGKKYNLPYGVAFQAIKYDRPVTELLFSLKPIPADKIALLLNQDKDGGDVLRFDPQIKLRFDEAGKLDYLFLYADGLSVNLGGPKPEDVPAEISVADGRVRGRAEMARPGALFKQEYRFEANFDAKLAAAPAAPGEAVAEPKPGELLADEEAGLPIPQSTTSRSSTKSAFRREVTAQVPDPLEAVVKFYRQQLPPLGFKENAARSKVASDGAQLNFTGAQGDLSVRIERNGNDTNVTLATRDPGKAAAAGVAPQTGKARIILGNASPREVTVVINGNPYKVPAGRGSKDPKDGISLHIQPGNYSVNVQAGGEQGEAETMKIAVGETWGVIVLPTGGHFADQLY